MSESAAHCQANPPTAPVRSMTGFGGAAATAPSGLRISVEITTVNRKNLDIALSAPREWSGLDARVGGWLEGFFQRGRIQVAIRVENAGQEDEEGAGSALLPGDRSALRRELAAFRAFAASEGLSFHPDAAFLLSLAEKTRSESSLDSWGKVVDTIADAVREAAAATVAMRETEGAALAEVLHAGVVEFEALRGALESAATGVVPNYRDLLLARLRKLGLELDLDDERVIREVALFADRCDISEELDRLKSHLEQCCEVLREGGALGRKLDFLCQEIHRECNTMGSKANDIQVTRRVLDAKNLLERIREQVQNIE